MDRVFQLNIGGAVFSTPCFFPSISSVKTNLPPLEYLRILTIADHPVFLISSYDIHHASSKDRASIDGLLDSAYSSSKISLLDSGNYESYWKKDNTWSSENFTAILRTQRFRLAFCYDNQFPSASADAIVDDVERAVLRDQESLHSGTVIPIVHASRDILPEVIYRTAERLHPVLLAVPERALGDGIFNRAETVFRIRSALDRVGYYCPLHLLGTGNPLSILIYAVCGADSFDGLEWCQTSVDHTNGCLFHFHQWDFFCNQTGVGKLTDLPYSQLVLVHNLLFYRSWMSKISEALKVERASELVNTYLPEGTAQAICRRLPGIL